MPTIRIDEKTWERLKSWAVPLEDSVDDVIAKVLDAADQKCATGSKKKKKAIKASAQSGGIAKAPAARLPQKEFRGPLLEEMYKAGGSIKTKVLREALEKRMAPQLSEADYERISTGLLRWWSAVIWERNSLQKLGLIAKGSPRGVWELSKAGKKFVEENKGK